MIHKWDTALINGLRYITGSRFISEHGAPDASKGEYPVAFTQGLIDKRGNLRWVIDEADPLRITEIPIPATLEQLAAEKDAEIVQSITAAYAPTDEVKLMNAAIEALAAGKALPQEYIDYRAAVAAIKLEAKNGKPDTAS